MSEADSGEPETKDAAAEPVGGDPEPAAPPPETADAWGQQIMAIEGSLASMLEESMLAAEQLNVKRTLAMRADIQRNKELDYDHGREHRKTGLPVGPSLLETDAGLIVHHGLLHAHELLVQVQMAQAARSAEPQGRDLIAEEASSRPPPHYMKSTANFDATYTSKGAIISTVKSLKARFLYRIGSQSSGSESLISKTRVSCAVGAAGAGAAKSAVSSAESGLPSTTMPNQQIWPSSRPFTASPKANPASSSGSEPASAIVVKSRTEQPAHARPAVSGE